MSIQQLPCRLSLLALIAALSIPLGCDDAFLEEPAGPDNERIMELEGDPLTLRDGSLSGSYGTFALQDEVANDLAGARSNYGQQFLVRANAVGEGGEAFAYVDLLGNLGTDAAPGTVYYSHPSESEAIILDEAGDSYVRLDDDKSLVETDEVYVVLCAGGISDDGEDAFYDLPADELLLEVVEAEEDEEPTLALGDEDVSAEMAERLQPMNKPDLEVRYTAIAWDRDEETWELKDTYKIATGRFTIVR